MLEKNVYRHLEDMITRHLDKDTPMNTDFLDPATQEEGERLCRNRGCRVLLAGGYPEAERRMLFLLPSYQAEPPVGAIACIQVSAKGRFAHPDLLGALMGMGVKRGCLGDLCVRNGDNGGTVALVYCIARMASHLAGIGEVGRQNVKATLLSLDEMMAEKGEGDGCVVTASLASLRADGVLAAAFNLSRSRGAALFDAGQVQLNWQECQDRGKLLKAGDTLSVRRHGRVVLEEIGGQSRKGRVFVVMKVFGGR